MIESQPLLPERKIPASMEYMPVAGKIEWIVGKWPALMGQFSIEESDLPAWHDALAGQGRPWLVIRRIFGVIQSYGSDDTDDLVEWTWKCLSDHIGVTEKALKADLDSAVDYWKKMKVLAASKQASGDAVGDAQDGGFSFATHKDLGESAIGEILMSFRFDYLTDKRERVYAANRCLELRHLLENKITRESSRQIIIMEMNLSTYESAQQALKNALNKLNTKSGSFDEERAKEIRQITESLGKLEKDITLLADKHRNALSEVGETDIEEHEKKRVALETISYLVDAHRKYYADGSRVLIDGVFTADEIVWLTTPLSIGRPAQYRPDVVLRIREAMEPENLWNPEYKPTVIQRDACRRLARLSQGLAEEMQPQSIPEIDDVEAGGTADDDEEESMYQAPEEPDQSAQGFKPMEIVSPEMLSSQEEEMSMAIS